MLIEQFSTSQMKIKGPLTLEINFFVLLDRGIVLQPGP